MQPVSVFSILIFLLQPFILVGQNALTKADEEYIKSQAQSYIQQFKTKVQEVGSSNQGITEKEKKVLIESTLTLFDDSATVEVVNSKRKNIYSISNYMYNVVGNYTRRFEVVFIRILTKNFNVSDLIPQRDANQKIIGYKCYYTYQQAFCAKKKADKKESTEYKIEDFDVCDSTWKSGEILIKRKFSPTRGDRWVISLGDIQANHNKYFKKPT